MAVPFRRTSKMKKRLRRTHFKLNVPGMTECPSCGEMKLSHRVCKSMRIIQRQRHKCKK